MAKKPVQFRQGDILITEVAKGDEVPELKAGNVKADSIIALGEATGHAHVVKGDAVLHAISLDNMYIAVGPDGGLVSHEALPGVEVTDEDYHNPIELKEGTYTAVRQREYDETSLRYVAD